jgi:cytochrome c553
MKTLALAIALCTTLPAFADSGRKSAPLTPQYVAECGSCHVAYPPALLGKAEWQKTMARLDRHFGTDASVDAATRHGLESYLERHARDSKVTRAAAEPRITRSSWFLREHDEVPQQAWKDPRVNTAANCSACHGGADKGRYAEAEIAIPGMPKRHAED